MPDIAVTEIEAVVTDALIAHGAEAEVAAQVARATAEAEAHGNTVCGLTYVESYCAALASGRVDGRAEPQVSQPAPGALRVDARFGFAQPAFAAALPHALDLARRQGVATLSVAHGHTCTSLGFFTAQIAREGLIALGFTNASPVVAPPGGTAPVIGTNPVAFSVPAAGGGLAVHFDAATTTVTLGAVKDAAAAGRSIPEGWASGPDGQPTTDPAEGIKGTLQPLGGAKGFGFGVMAEVLAAGLTGSANSLDVAGLKSGEGPPHDLGQFYILIDPAAHAPAFEDRVSRLSEAVAAQEGARLPGQARVAAETVAVPEALWQTVSRLAGR